MLAVGAGGVGLPAGLVAGVREEGGDGLVGGVGAGQVFQLRDDRAVTVQGEFGAQAFEQGRAALAEQAGAVVLCPGAA